MKSLASTVLAMALFLGAMVADSAAQLADKKVLTLEGAKKAVAAAAADAKQHNEGAAIAIVEGFPALSVVPGQFLLKDVVLLGAAVWSLGEALDAMGT
jgi:hypothetical protein